MKHFYLAALCLSVTLGCGTRSPADLEQAEPALRSALDAWKAGWSQKDLEQQNPSILMNEDDWREGRTLVTYQMEPTGVMHGRQVVWWAMLKTKDQKGKIEERRAKYVIDTTPRLVIVRDRFAR